MSTTNVTTTTQTTSVTVQENTVLIQLNNVGIQGVPGANNDPTYVTVRNSTGATLAKGTIVYISGANGNNVQVSPALATGDSTSARTLGWLAADIANNGSGLCMVEGYLEGLNTQGFTAGAQLYLSGTTAGAFTATKPVAPIHLVYVGVVTKVSSGDGHVFVKVQNGYELDELHNVLITSPTNAQVLAYDSATQLWKNATNAPDGVTSITAVSPLTGGTITSTGSIGLDQTALSITKSQVSDFTSGTVTSASTAQQSGTAVFANTSGTAVFATTSGTATYATTSGTAVNISGTVTQSQVTNLTSDLALKAPLASPTFSGTVTLPLANTGLVTSSGSGVVGVTSSAPGLGFIPYTGSVTGGYAWLDLGLVARDNIANVFTVGGHSITSEAAGIIPLILKGASGQTANLQVWQNDAGTVLGGVNGNAQIYTGSTAALTTSTGGATTATSGNGTTATISTSSAHNLSNGDRVTIAGITPTGYNGTYIVTVVSAFSFSYANATTGSQTVAGTVRVDAQASVVSRSAASVALLVRGATSQAASLFEVQDSTGSSRVRINQVGNSTFSGNITSQNNALFTPFSAATVPLTIQGASSQSANLQEWQNSAGTVVANMQAGGNLKASNVATLNSLAQLAQANSGGVFIMARATAQYSSPGANSAALYFRDGTNAGTLKLVVRAGAAGAETTILDNIPQ